LFSCSYFSTLFSYVTKLTIPSTGISLPSHPITQAISNSMLAACREDVDMLSLWHDKETAYSNNYSTRGARSGSHCCDQGTLWRSIGQRCHPPRLTESTARDQAANPPDPTPIRNAPFLPAQNGPGILAWFR